MIQISIFRTGGQLFGFCCEGHAGYAEEGEDIICSAVSALAINTVNSIETFTEDAYTADEAEDGGYLKLQLSEAPSAEAELLLKSFVLGVQNILESYGEDYLSISFSDGDVDT